MTVQSRTLQFGSIPTPSRYNSALVPVRNGRSLLSANNIINPIQKPPEEETFIDESEAVKQTLEEQGQSGEGILMDTITSGIKLLGSANLGSLAGTVGKSIGSLATNLGKAKIAFEGAKATGKLVNDLAFGKIGTTISNKLSEKFNNNPRWAPGFPGEQHVLLNTTRGLTRANYCGPQTQLLKRLNRGDIGVNQIDSACHKHDMLYHLARTPEDIRRADREMLREVDNVTDAGVAQKALAKSVIRGKILGENIGLFGPETFTSLDLEGSGVADRMEGAQRHMGQIIQRVRNLPARSIHSRFGANGISIGHLLSGNGIRKSGLLGNVKGRDPTISGMNTSFISGTGDNAIINVFKNRNFVSPNNFMLKGRGAKGGGILPEESRDFVFRKAIDPTISNMISSGGVAGISGNAFNLRGKGVSHIANPGGSGIIDVIADAAKLLPGSILKKKVIKTLKKERKKKIRQNKKGGREVAKSRGRILKIKPLIINKQTGQGAHQSGGQLGALAGLAASFIIPEVIKLFGGGKRKKSIAKTEELGKMLGNIFAGKAIRGKVTRKKVPKNIGMAPTRRLKQAARILAGAAKSGNLVLDNKGGQLIKKRQPVKIRKSAKHNISAASKLIMKLSKKHGVLPMNLRDNALMPLIKAAATKMHKKGKMSQLRGHPEILAGLAAKAILPKIISSIRKGR